MKTTVKKVYNSVGTMGKLYGMDVPVPLAFKLRRIVALLQPILDAAEETRVGLIGRLDTEGTGQVPDEKIGEFDLGMAELFGNDIDIDVPMLSVAELEKLPGISAADLDKISFLISEENSEN